MVFLEKEDCREEIDEQTTKTNIIQLREEIRLRDQNAKIEHIDFIEYCF